MTKRTAWNKTEFTKEQEEEMCSMSKCNSTYEIAKVFKTTAMCVYGVLKRNGVKIRSRSESLKLRDSKFEDRFWNSEKVKKENEIIKNEYDKRTPIKEMMKIVNLSEKALHERIKRMGIKLNRTHSRGERKKILCACGCGRELWNLDSQRRFRQYVNGHSGLTKINKLYKFREEIINLYKSGYNTRQLGKMFNVSYTIINTFLKRNGIDVFNNTTYGRDCISQDGHKVKSGMELEASDFFWDHKIGYLYEKRIGETRKKCDFYVIQLDLYIEIWGLNSERYIKNMENKIKLYKELGLNLLSIYPNDNIKKKLRPLLKISKVQRNMNNFEEKENAK